MEEALSESFFSVILAKELQPSYLSIGIENQRMLGKKLIELFSAISTKINVEHVERGKTTKFFSSTFLFQSKRYNHFFPTPLPNFKELLFCEKYIMFF